MALPFQAIYNTPLRLLIHHEMPLKERLEMLDVQLFWVVVLGAATDMFWKRAVRRIMINGG